MERLVGARFRSSDAAAENKTVRRAVRDEVHVDFVRPVGHRYGRRGTVATSRGQGDRQAHQRHHRQNFRGVGGVRRRKSRTTRAFEFSETRDAQNDVEHVRPGVYALGTGVRNDTQS